MSKPKLRLKPSQKQVKYQMARLSEEEKRETQARGRREGDARAANAMLRGGLKPVRRGEGVTNGPRARPKPPPVAKRRPDPQPRREAADAAAHHGSWAAARARKEAEAATKFAGTKTTFD